MSGPKLTQNVLLEVLVTEIESFRNTKEAYTKIFQQADENLKRLEALYNKPISVDIEAMRQEHTRINATLHQGLYIPKWVGINLLCLIIGFAMSVAFNYKQYLTLKVERTYIQQLESYIEKLEEQVPKQKTKR
jgi:hypothetical protein